MSEIELKEDEKQMIENKRLLEEKQKQCSDEINQVLEKYGVVLQVQTNPQILLLPKQ